MIDCKEAAFIADTKEFKPISISKRIGLKFHLIMCPHCKEYVKDSKAVDHILRYVNQHSETLTDSEKKLMLQKINEQLTN